MRTIFGFKPSWRYWLFALALTGLLAPDDAHAVVYGCSIAGQWQCYPSPQRCYKQASYLAVVKFPNYQACQQAKSPPKKSR